LSLVSGSWCILPTAGRSFDEGGAMKYRLRKVARVVLAAAITVIVAGAAAAVAIYVTGPGGLISCVPAAAPAKEPIPRWAIAAGVPALVAALMGLFFALAPERVFFRLVGLILTVALAAGTFYAVYTLLPAACRP
jgi:hypothetical protein